MEKILREMHTKLVLHAIDDTTKKHGAEHTQAFLDGMLSAVAVHLTQSVGPQAAHSVFQRLADECARSLVDETRA